MQRPHLLPRLGALALTLSFAFGTPEMAFAASSRLEVSGWIPYWRTEAGTADARKHLEQFTEINPFGYSVKSDGTLADTANLSQRAWQNLIEDAEDEKVRVVPTLMWSDTSAIHTVLSDRTKRARHVDAIADMVRRNGFDGVDIDYEGKRAETRPYFSAFLRELSAELKEGRSPKWLQCTIEARMPLEARYSGAPPANIEYANDLPKINQYCDRVRIMTYDQQTADIQLNRRYAKELYAPIADDDWVEKVVNYMDNDISRSKMMIGIATYGYIWQVMPKVDGSGYTYIKTESFNPRYGTDTAKEYDITPVRGPSGELGFSYVPEDNPGSLPSQEELSRLAPRNTASAYLASAGALAYAKSRNRQAPLTYLTWSDAGAIEQKIELAEDLGVKGISIFKIDGGVDPRLWDVLPDSAPKVTAAPKGSVHTDDEDEEVVPPPAIPTAPAPSGYIFTRDLEFGTEGADVLALQKILAAQGYLTATPNGYFGPATRAAVIAWQRANGLPGSGFFGPMSRVKMNGS